jgi:hypothetical protein
METIEQMAERHIRESEADLVHIDVLMKRAQKMSANAADQVEAERLLDQAMRQRAKLDLHLAALRSKQESDYDKLAEEGKRFKETLEKYGRILKSCWLPGFDCQTVAKMDNPRGLLRGAAVGKDCLLWSLLLHLWIAQPVHGNALNAHVLEHWGLQSAKSPLSDGLV